jgi:hypothetical protein
VVNMSKASADLVRRFEAVAGLQRVASADRKTRWWITVRRCPSCATSWLVGQDEVIHDFWALKRLSESALAAIINEAWWPADFDSYGRFLLRAVDAGITARFANADQLARYAHRLEDLSPDMHVYDKARALGVDLGEYQRLLMLPPE